MKSARTTRRRLWRGTGEAGDWEAVSARLDGCEARQRDAGNEGAYARARD